MPGRATATVVFYIVGVGEKAYILIDGVDVIPQLATAVGAVQQIRKDALFAILRFRRTALCPLDDLLLYLLKGVPVDNRLVNILEDDPVFFRVIDADPSDFGKLTEEVETLAGLLLEIKGDFPRRREIIDFKEYRFQVLEVDNRRILKVKFNRILEDTGNDENGKDTK